MPSLLLLPVLLRVAFAASTTSSYANGTTSKAALSSPSISCSADCTASALNAFWVWQAQPVGTTITAATIIYVVNNRTNTTSTITKYNSLPDGYTLPPTNSAGSQTAVITPEVGFDKSVTVTLTFPTGMLQDPVDYTWEGTLPTIGSMGQPVCSTGKAVIPYNPEVVTATTVQASTSSDDPGGLLWTLLTDGCYMPANSTRNPNDAAPKLCSEIALCPENIKATASFLTETSTSHVDEPPKTPVPVQDPHSSPAPGSSPGPGSGNSNPGPNQGQENGNSNPAAPASISKGQTQATPPPVVVGGSTYSASVGAGGSTVYNIGGHTLAAGSAIVIGSGPSATTVALQAAGTNTQVIVNGQTSAPPNSWINPGPTPFVVGGMTITPVVGSGGSMIMSVGGTSVAVGSTITMGSGSSATTVAFQVSNGQTQVVVNGKTTTMLSPTTTGGVGNAIISGLGGASTTSPVMFTSNAARQRWSTLRVLVQAATCLYFLLFWR